MRADYSLALFATTGFSAGLTDSLKTGKADIKSAGVMAFGPEGILFVGDSVGGAIFAFDTKDRTASQAAPVDVTGINEKVAAMLGTMPDQILINDLAVNPISKKMYLVFRAAAARRPPRLSSAWTPRAQMNSSLSTTLVSQKSC